MHPRPDPVEPGQESVWSFPRPARAEACALAVRIVHRGVTLLETTRSVRTLETSHPPSYYVPPEDIDMALLRPALGSSFCEWKGNARYHDVVIGGDVLKAVGWSYPNPSPAFEMLRGFVAFYAGPFDACTVDGAAVTPQAGDFYGGWITPGLAGPFKGGPGSRFW